MGVIEGSCPRVGPDPKKKGDKRLPCRQLQFQQWQQELESPAQRQQQTGVAGARWQMNTPLFSFQSLYEAYLQCRKNKRGKRSALEFEMNAEEHLLDLSEALESRAYRPLPSVCFVTASPKKREVFAANFRDRIVHHLLVSRLEPIWEPKFIYDSHACRKGKGIHAAAKRLQTFMRKATRNRTRKAYYLHIDVRSFFMSIDKRILFEILKRKVDDPGILWLLETVIFHDPTQNPIFKGQQSLFDEIPPHKSLFHTGNKTGLPIGNYSSQFFANVYLNELDQFAKHELKCRFYIRYVDDAILLSSDRSELEYLERGIEKFIRSRLALQLNHKRRKLASVKNGCDFLGYIVRPSHLLVRKRVVNRLKHKLGHYEKKLMTEWKGTLVVRHEPVTVCALQSSLASYLGHFSHASSYRLTETIFHRFGFIGCYFKYNPKNRNVSCITGTPRFGQMNLQYYWFHKRYPNALIFYQAGCFYEFYGRRAEWAIRDFGLKKIPPRPRLGTRTGFPLKDLRKHLETALNLSGHVVIVRQTGKFSGRLMARHVDVELYANRDCCHPAGPIRMARPGCYRHAAPPGLQWRRIGCCRHTAHSGADMETMGKGKRK